MTTRQIQFEIEWPTTNIQAIKHCLASMVCLHGLCSWLESACSGTSSGQGLCRPTHEDFKLGTGLYLRCQQVKLV